MGAELLDGGGRTLQIALSPQSLKEQCQIMCRRGTTMVKGALHLVGCAPHQFAIAFAQGSVKIVEPFLAVVEKELNQVSCEFDVLVRSTE